MTAGGAPAGLIQAVLPVGTVGVEAFGDAGAGPLFPAERSAVARAVPERVAEHTTVRHLARTALVGLGVAPVAIPTDEAGAPVWPTGIVGSLTHCAGYRAAAIARRADLACLGIDAEPDVPLPEGTLEVVASDAERAALAALPSGPAWDRLLFSVKESVFKAWHPVMRRWLGFEEAQVRLHTDGTASVRLVGQALIVGGRSVDVLTAHWHRARNVLLTCVSVRP